MSTTTLIVDTNKKKIVVPYAYGPVRLLKRTGWTTEVKGHRLGYRSVFRNTCPA